MSAASSCVGSKKTAQSTATCLTHADILNIVILHYQLLE
jgi:hypothetical protein